MYEVQDYVGWSGLVVLFMTIIWGGSYVMSLIPYSGEWYEIPLVLTIAVGSIAAGLAVFFLWYFLWGFILEYIIGIKTDL